MASSVTLSLLLLIVVLMSASLSTVKGYGRMVGGRTEVKDVEKNEEVQELGRFSVKEFNKIQRKHGQDGDAETLTFSRVVKAEKQVVSGIKYYLKIEASRHGVTRVFDSIVVVKPWVHSKELLNFAPISSTY